MRVSVGIKLLVVDLLCESSFDALKLLDAVKVLVRLRSKLNDRVGEDEREAVSLSEDDEDGESEVVTVVDGERVVENELERLLSVDNEFDVVFELETVEDCVDVKLIVISFDCVA